MDVLIRLYKDPSLLSTMMKKIIASRDQYCIDPQGVVRIKSNGQWVPYFELIDREELYDFDLYHRAANILFIYNHQWDENLSLPECPRYLVEMKAHSIHSALAEDFE